MSHSIIASVSAVVLSTGDFAEFLTSYNHAAILFSICAGFVASHTIDAPTHARFTVLAVLCGFFMGLCFATKQTIGGGLTLIVVTVMSLVMVHLSGLKRALSFVTLYTLGWLLPVGSLWAWFYENGVLELHFEQVFFSGVGGKGSPLLILLRPIILPLGVGFIRTLLLIALGTIIVWKVFARRVVPRSVDRAETIVSVLTTAGITLAVVVVGLTASYLLSNPSSWLQVLLRSTIYTTFLFHLTATLFGLEDGLFIGLTRDESHWWLCSAVSLGTCLTLTISAPAFEAMLLPGFAFLAAAALLYVGHTNWRLNIIHALLLFVVVLKLFSSSKNPLAGSFGQMVQSGRQFLSPNCSS